MEIGEVRVKYLSCLVSRTVVFFRARGAARATIATDARGERGARRGIASRAGRDREAGTHCSTASRNDRTLASRKVTARAIEKAAKDAPVE